MGTLLRTEIRLDTYVIDNFDILLFYTIFNSLFDFSLRCVSGVFGWVFFVFFVLTFVWLVLAQHTFICIQFLGFCFVCFVNKIYIFLKCQYYNFLMVYHVDFKLKAVQQIQP